MAELEDYLMHYGVKGMKWGVRKQSRSGSSHPMSADEAKKRELKKRPVHSLSNAELRQLNERLQLEKTLKEVSGSKELYRGEAKLKQLAASGQLLANIYNLATSPAARATKQVLLGAARR